MKQWRRNTGKGRKKHKRKAASGAGPAEGAGGAQVGQQRTAAAALTT